MNKSLFELMPSKALVTLLSANNIQDKKFSNPDWFNHYESFCKATGYKDISAEKFLTYVKFYGRLQSKTFDRMEVDKDGATTATVTRMMDSSFTKKSIADYREQMIGRYYAIR